MTLVSVTRALGAADDPTAVIAASRPAGDAGSASSSPTAAGRRWPGWGACDRSRLAARAALRPSAARWRELVARSVSDDARRPAGVRPGRARWVRFAPDGGQGPRWQAFAPASLFVPEVSLARRRGETLLTVNVDVAPDDAVVGAGRPCQRRLGRAAAPRAAAAARPRPDRPLRGPSARCRRRLRRGGRAGDQRDPRRASWRRSCSRAR